MQPATFSIQRAYRGREATAIAMTAAELGLTYHILDKAIPGTIPIGSVEFCSALAQFPIDFFPHSLTAYLNRPRYYSMGGHRLNRDSFVKDLRGWKTEFETKLRKSGDYVPIGEWMISEPVSMRNEWRYYVAEGDVIASSWYRGQTEDKPAPIISFPSNYSGTADFAETPAGLELIESHAPFACGWYGDDPLEYTYWQYMAWKHGLETRPA